MPPPAAGEVRVRHSAIGVNFSDVNVRRGGFYLARAATISDDPRQRGGRRVESVGPGVSGFKPGDRVVYAGMEGGFYEDTGAYAEERNVPASRLIRLPEDFGPAGGGDDGQGLHRLADLNRIFGRSPATPS